MKKRFKNNNKVDIENGKMVLKGVKVNSIIRFKKDEYEKEELPDGYEWRGNRIVKIDDL